MQSDLKALRDFEEVHIGHLSAILELYEADDTTEGTVYRFRLMQRNAELIDRLIQCNLKLALIGE